MKRALLIVDLQNDFMPGGALGVKEGDQIIPLINRLIEKFSLVIATQDWHPEGHVSFEELWPIHCVEGSHGAQFVQELNQRGIHHIIHKGTEKAIDSYSAFFDNDGMHSTGLDKLLKEKGVEKLYIAGLATDYCVLYSAVDALKLGYQVAVIRDACRPVYDEKEPLRSMEEAGAEIITTIDLT
ncbi:MAG: Streptothricin hydrolase [Chlamydiae bacterium]|nr:Streptothricin hydrolase [Chlamydiota bacterium]